MMRSLWAGVTGLQAHQIAMDVEGNNISNVNTTGFKYSRANFSDLLSQTSKIATAPQGKLGGKNPMQVGLGVEVDSVTKMFSQGSIQTTDKATDLAIQGDGFFVGSPDGGKTYKYTRNGDMVFDAQGNFVNNQGLVMQGWLRDKKTGEIDTTAPIGNIVIPPGLTTPANETSTINIKANLNSGESIENMSPVRVLDFNDGLGGADKDKNTLRDNEKVDDFSVLFTADGEAFNLKSAKVTKDTNGNVTNFEGGQGVEMSFDSGSTRHQFRYTNDDSIKDLTKTYTWKDNDGNDHNDGVIHYFRTTEDLRKELQDAANKNGGNAEVTVNENGKFQIKNSDKNGEDLNISVSAISDGEVEANERFLTSMSSFGGQLPAGSTGVKISQSINAATHASSIDVFDSLGTKHTVRVEFRKQGYVTDTDGTKVGTSWDMKIAVPRPGDISGAVFENELDGQIIFNSDGSLSSYTPSSITYTANNGSSPNQTIQLDFGSANAFDGITSFDNPSSTSGISQDGYPGGDLNGIRIDSTGTLVGSFTNGRSFGLGQMSMAKFTNNVGLESEGGGMFRQTANSGDPVIGQADTGGRGMIKSSSLEMSNVDLSKSLTQLIVIQRGFQANSKTITTSDQMLNTLLQLKQ